MLQQHWIWLLWFLAFVGVILALRERAVRYSDQVKQELEKYVLTQPPQGHQQPSLLPPPNPGDSATVAETKQAIWKNIQAHPLPPDMQIEVLVNGLASAQVDRRFAATYYMLYGSQLKFLRGLNQQAGTATRIATQAFLQQLGEQDARVKRHNLSEWISFLAFEGLVTLGVDTFHLTPIGQDFLVWVTRQQLPDKTHE